MKRCLVVGLVLLLAAGLVGWAAGERVLRFTNAWPTYIDPAVGSDFSSSSSMINLYDALVYPDTAGNPLPHVATSWDTSADGLVWTFHLRNDVRFHDGTLLTADDVKFSMDRMLAIGQGYGFLFVGRVESTEVVNDTTVRFTLTKPFGPFLTTLYRLNIVNKDLVLANIKKPGAYGDMGDYGMDYLLGHDAGSGPYKVKEFRIEEELAMTKNPDYFLLIPVEAPDEIHNIGTTEAATVRTMMARRELEIGDQWQSLEALNALDQISGVDIAGFNAGTVFYYMMHTRKAPTDDIHFRRAMAYAMDYETVVTKLFPGSFKCRGPISGILPGADPTLPESTRDLAKARAELAQSKYSNQLDQYEVELHWCAEVPDEEKVALLFQANMAEIGIKVKVVKVPWMSMIDEMAKPETSPHIVTVFDSSHYPEAGSLLESRYHSSSAPTWEQNEWLLDPVYDAMIEDAVATVDRTQRFVKYAACQRYIVDLCPTIFVFEQVEKHPYQTAYIDWPAARGEVNPIMGYNFAGRFIKVYPEKKP